MMWIAPSEKDLATDTLGMRLWAAADPFRVNSGLIFLRFAEIRFAKQRATLDKALAKDGNGHSPCRGSRVDKPVAYHADGIRPFAPDARFDFQHNPQLADVLATSTFSNSLN